MATPEQMEVDNDHRGTQRQFSENICSEDDLRSRIFGLFVVKFLACHLEFSGAFFLAEIFEKVSFDPLIIFGSLDFQLENQNRWKIFRG